MKMNVLIQRPNRVLVAVDVRAAAGSSSTLVRVKTAIVYSSLPRSRSGRSCFLQAIQNFHDLFYIYRFHHQDNP